MWGGGPLAVVMKKVLKHSQMTLLDKHRKTSSALIFIQAACFLALYFLFIH